MDSSGIRWLNRTIHFAKLWKNMIKMINCYLMQKKWPFVIWKCISVFSMYRGIHNNVSNFSGFLGRKSQVLLPPWKNRVDFTGYPSNHFPGCRLNEFMSLHLFLFVGSSLSTPLYPCLLISWFSSIPLIPFCLVCYFHPFLFIHSSLSIL